MLLVVSVFILRLQWMKADDLFLVDETKTAEGPVFLVETKTAYDLFLVDTKAADDFFY